MSKMDLRRAVGIAPNTMTKLNRDAEVTLEILGKICGVLEVNIGDIVNLVSVAILIASTFCCQMHQEIKPI